MKSHATRKPAQGPSERAAYVYMPPADGNSFASWPIAVAAQTQAISARPTESGSACCASGTEMKIEYATAAAGAMCVIDWKSTCGRPIECTRKRSKDRDDRTTPASIGFTPSCGLDLPRAILPRRRVMCPAAAEHGCDHVYFRQILFVRVVVEDDEVGEVAGQELAALVLVAREPRGIHGRGLQGLVQRQALL